jgi:hypothetical protein
LPDWKNGLPFSKHAAARQIRPERRVPGSETTMVISSIFLSFDNEILNVAAKLEKRCEAARAIAANALPGLDRLYWSKVAQDYADMAGTLRATVVLHHPEPLTWGKPSQAL